jgi:hypothetical protein
MKLEEFTEFDEKIEGILFVENCMYLADMHNCSSMEWKILISLLNSW